MLHEPEPLVNLGATVCDQLKTIFYPHIPWVTAVNFVAAMFTQLKIKMRAFYPDKTDIEILQEVCKYSSNDIKDIFG